MVYEYTATEIAEQIVRLLAYPRVGPLDPLAVAVNLGASLDDIEDVLAACIAEGRIRQLEDGRVTVVHPG